MFLIFPTQSHFIDQFTTLKNPCLQSKPKVHVYISLPTFRGLIPHGKVRRTMQNVPRGIYKNLSLKGAK